MASVDASPTQEMAQHALCRHQYLPCRHVQLRNHCHLGLELNRIVPSSGEAELSELVSEGRPSVRRKLASSGLQLGSAIL